MYELDSASLRMGHRCLVVVRAHTAKEPSSLTDPLRTCKPSLIHKRYDSLLRVVSQMMTRMNQARQEAIVT